MSQLLITIGSYALTGFIVSAIAQLAKQKITNKVFKLLFVVGLSIVGGGLAYLANFIPGNVAEVIIGVFAAANSIYLVVVKWFNWE